MVKDMLFSIIIPVFNVSINLLKRTIESAIGQSGDDTELIIVDDGSKAENSILYKNVMVMHKRNIMQKKMLAHLLLGIME